MASSRWDPFLDWRQAKTLWALDVVLANGRVIRTQSMSLQAAEEVASRAQLTQYHEGNKVSRVHFVPQEEA